MPFKIPNPKYFFAEILETSPLYKRMIEKSKLAEEFIY